MATSQLIEALQELAHERKIDEFYLIERLEESLANSYQRILDLEWDARVTIDRQTGKIYVYELVPVGEPDEETGEYSEFEERDVTPADVSRIAAQNAKSVIAAIAGGRDAASSIDRYLGGDGDISAELLDAEEPAKELGKAPAEFYTPAVQPQMAPAEERKGNFAQYECPFTEDEAKCEASRCLQCDLRLTITKPRLWNEY